MNKLISNEKGGGIITVILHSCHQGKMEVELTKYCAGCCELTNNMKRQKRVVLNALCSLPLGPFKQKLTSSVLLFLCLFHVYKIHAGYFLLSQCELIMDF